MDELRIVSLVLALTAFIISIISSLLLDKALKEQSMNRRIKKKRLKQWIKNNVKVTYSVERLDNGNCKLYAIIKGTRT